MAKRSKRLVGTLAIAALFLAAALFGTASGVVFASMDDLPQISALDDYLPGTITRVYGRDGSVIGDFAIERRQLVSYEEIPEVLRHAIISAEDGSFFNHTGINPSRIAITAVKRLTGLQQYGGASTLTQQLARQLFLTNEQTLERKIREALLAIQIEKRYTKEEIFTMYCNKIYWGHGAYGVEAASQKYFGKPARDLTLPEAAMIAGIIQGNRRQSPYENMDAAVRRRNYTLDRMAAERYITADEAAHWQAQPIIVGGDPDPKPSIAPYFLEMVRIQLAQRYGDAAVWEGGLSVRTGIDAALQQSANQALDDGLRRLDKLRGYRAPARNVVTEGETLEGYADRRWKDELSTNEIVPALVMGIEGAAIQVRAGAWSGTISRAGYRWTRRTADALVDAGHLIEIRVTDLDDDARTFSASLEQEPAIEGAVLAIENRTGQILAMAGGHDFLRSKFNRATQALRQVGSLFKPFVYATAIDRGYTAATEIDDSPATFDVGPDQEPYEPRNYDKEFRGVITLRQALETSRNVPAVKLMEELGPASVTSFARRFGITSPLPPFLSVAIGSAEGTLLEMVSAYTAWPNQGVRMEPLTVLEVTDRDGNILEQRRPHPHQVIRADTAYIMTNLLRGVVLRGSGAAANSLNWPLGGKTGTTDDFTDAWFIGFDPDITIGVWLGYDQKRSIGEGQSGTVAAVPVWMDVMRGWVERRRTELEEVPDFARPGNIVVVPTGSGLEAFIAGTEPGRR